jgi:hypothetical protein
MIGRMYPSWVERTVSNLDAYAGATFVGVLLKASYTYSSSSVFLGDIIPATHELSGGGYLRRTLTGMLVQRDAAVVKVLFDPITFSSLTATGANAPRYLVVAKQSGSDATSPLVLLQDFESASDLVAEDLVVTPSSAGLIRYTAGT